MTWSCSWGRIVPVPLLLPRGYGSRGGRGVRGVRGARDSLGSLGILGARGVLGVLGSLEGLEFEFGGIGTVAGVLYADINISLYL